MIGPDEIDLDELGPGVAEPDALVALEFSAKKYQYYNLHIHAHQQGSKEECSIILKLSINLQESNPGGCATTTPQLGNFHRGHILSMNDDIRMIASSIL